MNDMVGPVKNKEKELQWYGHVSRHNIISERCNCYCKAQHKGRDNESFLSTDSELSTETCSKNVYSPGPWTQLRTGSNGQEFWPKHPFVHANDRPSRSRIAVMFASRAGYRRRMICKPRYFVECRGTCHGIVSPKDPDKSQSGVTTHMGA